MERPTTAIFAGAVSVVLTVAGCRSDLSQQLLERELRMQEDQIYQLQDALAEKCARLDRVAGENSSLRRQLGVGDRETLPSGRGGPRSAPAALPAPRGSDPPVFVPPPIVAPSLPAPGALPAPGVPPAIPGAAPRGATPGVPGSIAPPALEGVPPLPAEPRFPGAAAPGRSGVVPVSGERAATPDEPSRLPPVADADGRPAGPPLSADESIAEAGKIARLVVNASRTACFDGDGDGTSEGLALVVEPRDGDERLVTAAGDVSIAVFDTAAAGPPVAVWEIPAAEAATRFRRTSRNRGLHFVLRWPGPPPRAPHVRVAVSLTTFDGSRYETDATVGTTGTASGTEP